MQQIEFRANTWVRPDMSRIVPVLGRGRLACLPKSVALGLLEYVGVGVVLILDLDWSMWDDLKSLVDTKHICFDFSN